jgi:hypothetical protein
MGNVLYKVFFGNGKVVPVTKMYVGVEIKFNGFVISALDGREWSASSSGRVIHNG